MILGSQFQPSQIKGVTLSEKSFEDFISQLNDFISRNCKIPSLSNLCNVQNIFKNIQEQGSCYQLIVLSSTYKEKAKIFLEAQKRLDEISNPTFSLKMKEEADLVINFCKEEKINYNCNNFQWHKRSSQMAMEAAVNSAKLNSEKRSMILKNISKLKTTLSQYEKDYDFKEKLKPEILGLGNKIRSLVFPMELKQQNQSNMRSCNEFYL